MDAGKSPRLIRESLTSKSAKQVRRGKPAEMQKSRKILELCLGRKQGGVDKKTRVWLSTWTLGIPPISSSAPHDQKTL